MSNSNNGLYIRLNEGEHLKLAQGSLFKIKNSTFEVSSINQKDKAGELVLI